MLEFFKQLPENEKDFVEPMMMVYLAYYACHSTASRLTKEKIDAERIKYSNLYRTLASEKDFIAESKWEN